MNFATLLYVQVVVAPTEVAVVFSLFKLRYLFAVLCRQSPCTVCLGLLWFLVPEVLSDCAHLLVAGAYSFQSLIKMFSFVQLKSQALDLGFSGDEIGLYLSKQQTLKREERAMEKKEKRTDETEEKRKNEAEERKRKEKFKAGEQEKVRAGETSSTKGD